MRVSFCPLFLLVLTLLGLGALYYIDPSREYPSVTVEGHMTPGENMTVTIPYGKRDIGDVVDILFPKMDIFLKTDNSGLILLNLMVPLIPGISSIIPDGGEEYTIHNGANYSQDVVLKTIRAPPPDKRSQSTSQGMLVLSVLNVIISGVYASLVKRPYVQIRSTHTGPSCLVSTFCCCFKCGRMPKTPHELEQEAEERRRKHDELERTKNEKASKQRAAQRKSVTSIESVKNLRAKQIQDGTYIPTLWERLFGIPETRISSVKELETKV